MLKQLLEPGLNSSTWHAFSMEGKNNFWKRMAGKKRTAIEPGTSGLNYYKNRWFGDSKQWKAIE